MRTRPPDLDDTDVSAALRAAWDIAADSVAYRPVGFGSHHWEVAADGRRWFLTVDDLGARARSVGEPLATTAARLVAALATARDLADGGLAFVVAPIRATDGAVVVPLGERFAASLYPFVDGTAHEWGEFATVADRLAVLDLVVRLHGEASTCAAVDDLVVPMRDELMAAMDDLAGPWESGPYGEPARELLARHVGGVRHLIERHDRLAADALARPERFVLTHGEPHPANTMTTAAAGLVLVDWDTTLLAPPERDLWTVAGDDRSVVAAYVRATGRAVLDDVLTCYRLCWDLSEIALYIALFRAEHGETDDARESWHNLRHFLDPDRRWPR